jgi:ABC-2 type transport system ATP-binding protein
MLENASVLVEVHSLSRNYGQLQAIKDISFSIQTGEVLGFLGPNGAGKTTTMQIISGNLAPSSGRVTIAGHDLREEPRAAKAGIGYLPEHPPVYRELTVDEYLDYCAALRHIPRQERKAAREAAKEKCGLQDNGGRLIGNLSKGFQQRVGLAQAIIHLPPLIILDEPTVGLDPIQIREIRGLIRELGKHHGVILSTHILPEVQASCDRVQIISKGLLVFNDTIDNLSRHLQSSALMVAFRQAPETALLEKLPGVKSVKSEEVTRGSTGSRVRIFHQPGLDPTDQVIKLAAEKNWGLYEINPERASLEQVFVDLTTEEPAPDTSGNTVQGTATL